MKYTVAATVRNEGPFLLEWLAWQKTIGFDDVLFAHNDCTDGSDVLMRLLTEAGWCHEVEHCPGNLPPVRKGLNVIHRHPVVKNSDWLFICDVDEYLIPKVGDLTVQALLEGLHEKFVGVSVQWKVFGTSGQILYTDLFLHQVFTRAARTKSYPNAFMKSFMYKPQRFGKFNPHTPRGVEFEGEWGVPPNQWGRVNGAVMNYDPNGEDRMRTKRPFLTHEGAQLNHYILKWVESANYKAGSPCPLRPGNFQRYTDEFFEKHDCNDELDEQALAFDPKFNEIYAQIMAVPGVKRQHHLCCADYVRAMNEKRGTDVSEDLRYAEHMDLAHSLS